MQQEEFTTVVERPGQGGAVSCWAADAAKVAFPSEAATLAKTAIGQSLLL